MSHYVKDYNQYWLQKTKYLFLEGEIGMKRKILACVVACATLFLGMGYAYWTDGLQIASTADSGKLEVKFVDLDAYGTYGDETGKWAVLTGIPGNDKIPASKFFDDGSYNEFATLTGVTNFYNSINHYTKTTFAAVQVNGVALTEPPVVDNAYHAGAIISDKIAVDIDNIYPGYAQLFRTDILNTGTLAAKLASMSIQMGGSNDTMKNMIGISLSVLKESGAKIRVLDSTTAGDYFMLGGEKFIRISKLTPSMIQDMTAGDDLLYIYPDDDNTFDAVFGVAMDPDYGGTYTTGHVGLTSANNDSLSQIKSANFTIDFGWDQFNTKPNAAN